MIPHTTVLASLLIGVPQGAYLAVQVAKWLGITGVLEVVLVSIGCLAGLFVGYAEIVAVRKLLHIQ